MSVLAVIAACSSGGSTTPVPASSGPAQEIPTDDTPAPAPPDTPTPEPEPTPSVPSGAVAIFYRVTFGSNTEYLKGSGYNITWENDTKGILRYIPATDQLDVMKRITSPSYSKSSIYPVTIGGRLFTYRDWGSDWTIDNQRFDVAELDITTGATLSSNSFSAEWFTVAGDRLYYRSKISRDLFGNPRGGGDLMVVGLGSTTEEELPVGGVYFRGVGGHLVSFSGSEIVQYDPATGSPTSSKTLSPRLMRGIWPSDRAVFYGTDALYWAVRQAVPNQIAILRIPLEGNFETLTTIQLLEGETGLVIDDDQEWVAIALTGSTPGRGFTVKRVLLYNTRTGILEELEVNQHIPLSTSEAGWGFQIAVMP